MDINKVFKELTGETDANVVSSFLDMAECKILSETNRPEMTESLKPYQVSLAIAMYNKNGDEGKISSSEGGVNDSYESEEAIIKGIDKYRLTATARRLLDEKKKAEEILD